MLRWTVKDCIEHLQQLKNPFEKSAGITQKPKLADILNSIGGKEVTNAQQAPKLQTGV